MDAPAAQYFYYVYVLLTACMDDKVKLYTVDYTIPLQSVIISITSGVI